MNDRDAATALNEIAGQFWEACLEADPFMATGIGAPGHDAELPPIEPEQLHAIEARMRDQRAAAVTIPVEALSDDDRVTRQALLAAIDASVAFLQADPAAYTINPMGGPQVEFLMPATKRRPARHRGPAESGRRARRSR